jgi:hypothetical protein
MLLVLCAVSARDAYRGQWSNEVSAGSLLDRHFRSGIEVHTLDAFKAQQSDMYTVLYISSCSCMF